MDRLKQQASAEQQRSEALSRANRALEDAQRRLARRAHAAGTVIIALCAASRSPSGLHGRTHVPTIAG